MSTESNREIMHEFARLFYTERDVEAAFARYVAPGYLQHNPNILDGRDAAVAGLRELFATPGAGFEILRILVDGDLALVHVRAEFPGSPPLAVADIYRLQDGMLVEHWDVLQARPDDAANPNALF